MDRVGPRALIVEGGALRGAFSCGVLDVFLEKDFSPFDSLWGVSSGATNVGAYQAKMPGRNHKIYTDYALRREFVRPWQFLRGGDLIDLDWMWEITLRELGIDHNAMQADGRPFYLVVTNQSTAEAEYHLATPESLADTMKASSALPGYYRNGVELNGQTYVDGGVADSIPVAKAIEQGATQIMVIRSQPKSYRKPHTKTDFITNALLKSSPLVARRLNQRAHEYNATLDLIRNPPQGVKVLEVCPPEGLKLSRLSRSSAKVEASYQLGRTAALSAIEQWPS
ncbi:patatin-like phospholipase family protein [Paraferrimonas sedimenticola]|uniref:Patatin family protein n=1 Tax=Paraferrimonas sedimenticola TaxID=375674 RepID=A0AA37W0U1_9GAMM|nr:patatin family protein [Paraferrimonas sedimenticola]GLP95998.1 patatin family protein [Paraferrimonas sedimenticola]